MKRACRRRACARKGRSLRRRYGCFRLPTIPGATVKEAKRKDVNWLARTDPQAREVEFSHAWDELPSQDEKRYIVLHEQAHLETGPDHNDHFYSALKRLVEKHRVPWKVAYDLESWNCHKSH